MESSSSGGGIVDSAGKMVHGLKFQLAAPSSPPPRHFVHYLGAEHPCPPAPFFPPTTQFVHFLGVAYQTEPPLLLSCHILAPTVHAQFGLRESFPSHPLPAARPALQFVHYSGPEYQTEVALLSRNILLQSSADVEGTWRGGMVRIRGQGRLQGVLAYRLGQYNNLGAYPIHWHMVPPAPSGANYAHDCAVFRSFYRCFVVHGPTPTVLLDNVAFHAQGNCFYLEDGVEEYNWLEHNLAAFVHVIGNPAGGPSQTGTTHYQAPNLAHPADAAASAFYAANANNAFVNNAASGGEEEAGRGG